MQCRHAGFGATELRWERGCNCDLVKEGKKICSLYSHYPIISPSLSSLYQSFSVSLSLPRAPTSPKPLCYSLRRGLRWRDFALLSLRVGSFPVQSATRRACIYQQGDISCYECQGSTCDIILLLMAHRVIGPLISPGNDCSDSCIVCVCACVCVCVCHIKRP